MQPHPHACMQPQTPPPPPNKTQIVTVKRPGRSYVLYQCGTPDPTGLPPGAAAGIRSDMRSFEIPLYSVAVTDTTANGFLVGLTGGQAGGVPTKQARNHQYAHSSMQRTPTNICQTELGLFDRVALASPYSVDSCMQKLAGGAAQGGGYCLGSEASICPEVGAVDNPNLQLPPSTNRDPL
jgi:hypothetical protein